MLGGRKGKWRRGVKLTGRNESPGDGYAAQACATGMHGAVVRAAGLAGGGS